MNNNLCKSKKRTFFGVCQGLANYTGIDVSAIRLGFVFGSIFTGSILFWIYIILALILPLED